MRAKTGPNWRWYVLGLAGVSVAIFHGLGPDRALISLTARRAHDMSHKEMVHFLRDKGAYVFSVPADDCARAGELEVSEFRQSKSVRVMPEKNRTYCLRFTALLGQKAPLIFEHHYTFRWTKRQGRIFAFEARNTPWFLFDLP
ncbi:MAG: hypothetical protein ACRBB0_20390 [Pelagimonas sp.]|uniref:hypothetical protein n=1 Tax=Pelagimonas sp. TaxID=2073170 RepID=UPI003D6A26CB